MLAARAEADYGLTSMAFGTQDPNDAKLLVKFHLEPHQDQEESEKQGRPIFKNREYITIIVPGDKDSIVTRPVWDQDLQRFAQQYARFKQGLNQEIGSGTPLSQWPPVTKSQVLELNFFNVHTVEQLADLADNHAQKFAGINQLRSLARAWIAKAKDSSQLTAMQAELEKRDNKIEVQNRTITDLSTRLEAMEKLLNKKGG